MKKVLSLVLCLCMVLSAVPALAYTAGTYTGEGTGNNPDVKIVVEVIFSDDAITDIKVVSHEETPGICDPAMERIPAAVVEAQSLAVDAVTGATNSSNGILAAIEDAAVKAGADINALKTAAGAENVGTEKTETEQTTDVLVIGAGVAGMSAALAARESGLNVTVIDKMAAVGGTTNLAGGILVSVNSELFKDNRLESDNLEAVLAYWKAHMAKSGVDSGYPDWDRLENVLADTGANVDWLVANGIEFAAEPYAGSATYPMALANGGGAGLASMLCKSMTEKGVTLITECKGTELITDDTGAVVGAKAETADSEITFHAKAVILATGGISQNEELVAKYSPKLHRAGLIPTSAVSHTGDGFLMALAVGAGTFDSFATPLFGTTVDPAFAAINPAAAGLTIYDQLGVNADGMRFGNEAASAGWDVMDYTASDMIQNGIAPFWYIYDSSDPAVAEIMESGVADDVVAKGENIEELALDMHVYTAVLKGTFEAYNAAAAAGEDAEFNKPAAFLKALTQAPFYAVKVYPTTFGSAGGVTTTEQGRVTRQDGTVIPGLYAAGEMSNRYFYNENYILAASLGLYSTMGHRAGAAAAEDAMAK
ncbi:MAG: FAD-dependent oxidoreductase [Clostridia bacterium]|nr:FAD-dependent oxidoreductase [Clostridia bacterium]